MWLVVRAFGVIGGILRQHIALAGFGRGVEHLVFPGMATQTIGAGGSGIGQGGDGDDVAHGVQTSS